MLWTAGTLIKCTIPTLEHSAVFIPKGNKKRNILAKHLVQQGQPTGKGNYYHSTQEAVLRNLDF
jgi:hypothetical protein